MTQRPETPVCNYLNERGNECRHLVDFLEWLSNVHDVELPPGSYDAVVHEYMGIDRDALEKERRALLAWCNSEVSQ